MKGTQILDTPHRLNLDGNLVKRKRGEYGNPITLIETGAGTASHHSLLFLVSFGMGDIAHLSPVPSTHTHDPCYLSYSQAVLTLRPSPSRDTGSTQKIMHQSVLFLTFPRFPLSYDPSFRPDPP